MTYPIAALSGSAYSGVGNQIHEHQLRPPGIGDESREVIVDHDLHAAGQRHVLQLPCDIASQGGKSTSCSVGVPVVDSRHARNPFEFAGNVSELESHSGQHLNQRDARRVVGWQQTRHNCNTPSGWRIS